MNHTTRTFDLKRMLNHRRREVLNDTPGGVPGIESDRLSEVGEKLRGPDASTMANTERALLQTGLDTVARIDAALARLDSGRYGSCLECAREISVQRLGALPFAERCQTCEERRQQELEWT